MLPRFKPLSPNHRVRFRAECLDLRLHQLRAISSNQARSPGQGFLKQIGKSASQTTMKQSIELQSPLPRAETIEQNANIPVFTVQCSWRRHPVEPGEIAQSLHSLV